jgi:uncharacterized protein YecE (DUF72 family)
MAAPKIKVGCCGLPCAKARYYELFSIVELQRTFYELPRLELLEKWRREAPQDFEFTIKASQFITHPATSPTYRRVTSKLDDPAAYGGFKPTPEVRAAWESVLTQVKILKARTVVFQTPSSFGPSAQNLKNLKDFFSNIDREGLTLAWESRGDWPVPLLKELCTELGLIDCVDPFLRPSTTEGLFYLRLHGGKGYRKKYSDEELAWLKERYSQYPGYILFNNIHMLDDARRMQEILWR